MYSNEQKKQTKNFLSHAQGSLEAGSANVNRNQMGLAKINLAAAAASIEAALREIAALEANPK